jgi:hypothetical protein
MEWLFVLYVLAANSSPAVNPFNVTVVPLKGGTYKSVITVTGAFKQGDEKIFSQKLALAEQPAIVSFNSSGGAISVAFSIGEQIRARKLVTFVPEGWTCASACALAWLGGWPRYMQGKVGFHAAYEPGPNHEVSSTGNALVGAYLAKLGEPMSAIVFVTTAPPESMRWLTKAEGMKVDIGFEDTNPTAMKAPAPVAARYAVPAKWPDVPPPALAPSEGTPVVAVSEPCESGLSEIFGNKSPNARLLHQLCAKP